ncbi:MAG: hypothetical protein IIA67_08010 [Planctomycetes bacterium]|nr:hypothetical protein [Planctomycetota bacterium]
MSETQREIDFTRGEMLGLIRKAKLPRQPGVSSTAMKAVLRAIDDFARGKKDGCWASIKTPAAASIRIRGPPGPLFLSVALMIIH